MTYMNIEQRILDNLKKLRVKYDLSLSIYGYGENVLIDLNFKQSLKINELNHIKFLLNPYSLDEIEAINNKLCLTFTGKRNVKE